MARIFRRLYDFPKPTIAAVNGAAIAGGTGIATMCDFTLAVPEAKFGYKPTTVNSSLDMLAVFVNKDNPIKGLTLMQVDAIYSSTRKLGGKEDRGERSPASSSSDESSNQPG